MLKNIFYIVFIAGQCVVAREFYIQPYLQDAEPDSIVVMWESAEPIESVVYWGSSSNLDQVAEGTRLESSGKQWIHTVRISGLTPSTQYFYSTAKDGKTDPVFHFTTPPVPSKPGRFNFVALSDVQIDKKKPNVFRDICAENIPQYFGAGDIADAIAFMLVPGDLGTRGRIMRSGNKPFSLPLSR